MGDKAHQADIAWQFSSNPPTMKECVALIIMGKEEGNKCFKAMQYDRATAFYRTALGKIRTSRMRKNLPDAEGQKVTINELEVSLYQNLAVCLVKTSQWEEAITACTAALRLDPSSAKARLFRARALAASPHRSDGLSKAREDLAAAHVCHPADKVILAELAAIEKRLAVGHGSSTPVPIISSPPIVKDTTDRVLGAALKLGSRQSIFSGGREDERAPPPPSDGLTLEERATAEAHFRKMAEERAAAAEAEARRALQDDGNANSGYKVREESGAKVPAWSRPAVVDSAPPQRIANDDAAKTQPAFNRGYRERDMSQWCASTNTTTS